MSDEKIESNQLRIEGIGKRLTNLEEVFYETKIYDRISELEASLEDLAKHRKSITHVLNERINDQTKEIAELRESMKIHDEALMFAANGLDDLKDSIRTNFDEDVEASNINLKAHVFMENRINEWKVIFTGFSEGYERQLNELKEVAGMKRKQVERIDELEKENGMRSVETSTLMDKIAELRENYEATEKNLQHQLNELKEIVINRHKLGVKGKHYFFNKQVAIEKNEKDIAELKSGGEIPQDASPYKKEWVKDMPVLKTEILPTSLQDRIIHKYEPADWIKKGYKKPLPTSYPDPKPPEPNRFWEHKPREDLYFCRLCGNEITDVEHEANKLTREVKREDLQFMVKNISLVYGHEFEEKLKYFKEAYGIE